jgi:hypothetical protein
VWPTIVFRVFIIISTETKFAHGYMFLFVQVRDVGQLQLLLERAIELSVSEKR